MKQVLVYGESLSWGLIPGTRKLLDFNQRWPGVFEKTLLSDGHALRVFENCINGRRTVWSDPFKAGRNGSKGLAQVIEMHSPLSLVVMMLGVNDFQSVHTNSAALSALGSARLIEIIRSAPVEPGVPVPEILLLAPPIPGKPKGEIKDKFKGVMKRSSGLSDALKAMALQHAVHYFDTAPVVSSSKLDGIHLDPDQHHILGTRIAQFVDQNIWQATI
jgi:lysophospholipase L1-like esterase